MKKLLFNAILCLNIYGIVHAQEQTDTISIFFDIGKSVVDSKNALALDELVANKNIVSISIYGYADFLGRVAYNKKLSEERSANVCTYLLVQGIDKDNIVLVKGEGIHPNSLEKNRRDLSDKGIKAHRMAQVIYTVKIQYDEIAEEIPVDENIVEELAIEIPEEELVVNNHIVMGNILFYNASYRLRPESYPSLEALLATMQKHSNLRIEIHGHICCQSDDMEESYVYGVPISLSRAKAVYDYLVANGVDSSRISYKGFGSTRKKFPLERDEYEKDMNRRVEILILEI